MSVVTISRQEACRGEEVAAEVARRLGFRLVDRPLMRQLIYSYDLLSALGRLPAGPEVSDEEPAVRQVAEGIIHHLAFREHLVLLGYGGQFLFRDCPGTLHVRLVASLEHRMGVAASRGATRTASALVAHERARRRLVKRFLGADLARPEHYDLILRMDRLRTESAAGIIERAAAEAGLGAGDFESIRGCALARGAHEIPLEPLPAAGAAVQVPFANQSEVEFARVLDFYRIAWKYEPESFPIEWWPDGRVKSSFTPDFYLPDTGTYLELTTMRQALVTKKNRKVRLFRQLYPDKKLQIFYGRDIRKLAQKYGLE